ncbi:uncharacterized protein NECHADRAFT_79567 [Fusarium vanettenii 77-13-4]|uniref:Uncharacterized protein n=1 Tax=Fusarium vanettenii (strain ATCC MYA-4622 / CBS 123669 / FGSC 9596 / NRRL 45880 / 77-13-4) TaxID=660122 RepID=C7Z7V1_FUSV7|nr:uncharacterized protein NECHADRAFT_79567 [Fusarium vanettenii 77-13-4]EEU39890.1 predicted protein [Fusarium vanettenii 77-13-4]
MTSIALDLLVDANNLNSCLASVISHLEERSNIGLSSINKSSSILDIKTPPVLFPRPIVDCEVYTNEPYVLDITSEYTRRPQEGLETIFTGFGSTIKNFVDRHRRRRNKVLSVTVQVTLRRVTIGAVINLPPPVPGKGKHTRVFRYTISAGGKDYPLKLWVKTSRGQLIDGEDGSSPEEPGVEDYYRASLHYARWMVESFYQFSS